MGGAAAVATANVAIPSRRAWHSSYYGAVFATKGGAVGAGAVAVLSAVSGAVVIGGTDIAAQRLLGLRW